MTNGIRTENSLDIFETSQSYLGQSLPGVVFAIFTSIYPLTRLIGLAVQMSSKKRLLNFLETRTPFNSTENNREGRLVYK